MNKKGQALVEFVLLIPIIIMILFVIIDFSNIYYSKNHLEGVLSDTIKYVENGKTISEIKNNIGSDYSLDIKISNGYATITLEKSVKLITPAAETLFNNPYVVTSSRTIIYE